jgi:hypothetical protein
VYALQVNKIPVAHGGGVLWVIRYQWRGSGSARACATGSINRCAMGSCFPSSVCLYRDHFIYGPWPFYYLFHPLFFLFFELFLVLYCGPRPL